MKWAIGGVIVVVIVGFAVWRSRQPAATTGPTYVPTKANVRDSIGARSDDAARARLTPASSVDTGPLIEAAGTRSGGIGLVDGAALGIGAMP